MLQLAPRDARIRCPHWQNMGCLLDTLERACGSPEDEEPEDEQSTIKLIRKHARESAWMCCCPEPYKACKHGDMVSACTSAMHTHISPLLEKYSEGAGHSKGAVSQDIQDKILAVRSDLLKAGGEACTSTLASHSAPSLAQFQKTSS